MSPAAKAKESKKEREERRRGFTFSFIYINLFLFSLFSWERRVRSACSPSKVLGCRPVICLQMRQQQGTTLGDGGRDRLSVPTRPSLSSLSPLLRPACVKIGLFAASPAPRPAVMQPRRETSHMSQKQAAREPEITPPPPEDSKHSRRF